jgi:type VI protein secretion system component VasK
MDEQLPNDGDRRPFFRRLLRKLISWIIFLGLIQWITFILKGEEYALFRGILSLVMIGLGFLSIYALIFSIFRSQALTSEEWQDWREKRRKRREKERHDEDDRRASDPFYW